MSSYKRQQPMKAVSKLNKSPSTARMPKKNFRYCEKYGITPYTTTSFDVVVYYALFPLERQIAVVLVYEGKEISRVLIPSDKCTGKEYTNAHENMGL